MRQPIDSAPKDGKDIWVEDATGAFEIARWSPQAGNWVWKNECPILITPTHWYPITEDVFQKDEQASGWLRSGRAGLRLAVSLIAVVLVAAALVGVFDPFSEHELAQTAGAGNAVRSNPKAELAGWQPPVQREAAAVLM